MTVNALLFPLMTLFAEGDGGAPKGAQGGSEITIIMVVGMAAFMYFLMYAPAKRERKRMELLLGSIKKNDKVQTASGIYGVVTDVSKETNKVTVRIDESSGTKVRMDLTSIVKVLADEPAADSSSK